MKFSIVAHTHWDREWHKTFEEYRVRLVDFFGDLIETLENDTDFSCFVMDGQMVVFEDYLAIVPEKKDVLTKLIQEKRIIIGPWYTQPDELIPSGESLIRNLLIGQEMAKEYTDEMKIGYLPDSFGQSGNIPQLLSGFDYKRAIFWRGMTGNEVSSENFIWQSLEGSQVETTVLSQGYGNARDMTLDLENNISIIEENISNLSATSPSGHILLMCGFDQRKIKKDLPKIIRDLNRYYEGQHDFTLSTLDMYQNNAFSSDLNKEVVTGEFRKGKYMRVHVGIGMTRADIKRKNYDVQTQLFKKSEPLSAMRFIETKKYPKALHDQASKYMMQNQAHDSICCVCTDDTHREMMIRYDKALQISSELDLMAFNDILSNDVNQGTDFNQFSIFNFNGQVGTVESKVSFYSHHKDFQLVYASTQDILPYTLVKQTQLNLNDTTIEIGVKNDDIYVYKNDVIIKPEVKGFGLQSIEIVQNFSETGELNSVVYDDRIFTTDNFTLTLEDEGTFTYIDKSTKEAFKNINKLVENGNAGDEYDYSPPVNDIKNIARIVKTDLIVNTHDHAILDVYYLVTSPINSNVESRSDETEEVAIKTQVCVSRTSKRIDFNTIIQNTVKNHRISVEFQNNQKTEEHFSEQQFGLIWRDNQIDIPDEEFKDWQEKYYPVFPQQRFTGFNSLSSQMVILNKGLVTYELLENQDTDIISIPLLTSTDHMGKQDLLYRPGRRSGLHVETPDSELIGTYEFNYAFYSGELSVLAQEGDKYQVSPQLSQDKGKMQSERKYFSINSPGLSLQTVKKAINMNGIILRLVNLNPNNEEQVSLSIDDSIFKTVSLTNFAETICTDQSLIEFSEGKLLIKEIKANQVLSLYLERK
ncbi:glycosyl hydrolase-related protein [Streptococcus parauberis]|uniref:glycoside hydrolase family 38 N-terminal domain-containing protein n=1 Tax=Streptococcus parauberis TaxID=1348 RepID=UPI000E2FFA67|nr:glycosyl hydrolase-related protein [Streptococcus parauberis]RFE00875.1 Mannosylglycerate hydrolase [Streptococcus parauberis]